MAKGSKGSGNLLRFFGPNESNINHSNHKMVESESVGPTG